MSRALSLARAIGSDGVLNVGDVAGLAAVASSGSASDLGTGTLPNARLASGAAVANLGYTPVNKAGDTMTGTLAAPFISTGSSTGVDVGPNLYSGNANGDYSRIRAYEGASQSNFNTIHFFNANWQGGNFRNNSAGAVNLTGKNGVTMGAWNNPSMVVYDAGLGGYVITPQQPAFVAGGSANVTLSAGNVVPFGLTEGNLGVNRGGCYNTSNYRFTAPVAGLYFFSFSIYNFASQAGSFCLAKNGAYANVGSDVVLAFEAGSAEVTIGYSTYMPLSAGDYVEVIVRPSVGGTYQAYLPHSVFCGHLIG